MRQTWPKQAFTMFRSPIFARNQIGMQNSRRAHLTPICSFQGQILFHGLSQTRPMHPYHAFVSYDTIHRHQPNHILYIYMQDGLAQSCILQYNGSDTAPPRKASKIVAQISGSTNGITSNAKHAARESIHPSFHFFHLNRPEATWSHTTQATALSGLMLPWYDVKESSHSEQTPTLLVRVIPVGVGRRRSRSTPSLTVLRHCERRGEHQIWSCNPPRI